MEKRKLVKSVKIFADSHGDAVLAEYTEGVGECSTINFTDYNVEIILRVKDDLVKEKPYEFYSGFKFVAKEIYADIH